MSSALDTAKCTVSHLARRGLDTATTGLAALTVTTEITSYTILGARECIASTLVESSITGSTTVGRLDEDTSAGLLARTARKVT